eukprot:GHRR01030122.1.p1 GENE.GHRR01030122.1~~GHRR01030122.1.p1  ORF type:complete len:171 (+),score=52.39 GHRR01030122.1:251-763(+)
MATPNIKDFLASNDAFAAEFDKGHLPIPPARKALVLACMDARLHLEKVLGLGIGDAHVVRNAGGRATEDALRSIAISQRLLSTTEVVVVHHTDCGMLTFTDATVQQKIRDELGDEAGAQAAQIKFLPFSDLEQSVRDDVSTIQQAAVVDKAAPVHGFIYDVKSGKLTPVQ